MSNSPALMVQCQNLHTLEIQENLPRETNLKYLPSGTLTAQLGQGPTRQQYISMLLDNPDLQPHATGVKLHAEWSRQAG